MVLVWLLLSALAIDGEFSAEVRTTALAGTVRIINMAGGQEGCGVLVKRSGPFVYILTNHQIVGSAEQVSIQTYTASPTPKAGKLYRSGEVIVRSKMEGLALVRLATGDVLSHGIQICPPLTTPREQVQSVLAVDIGPKGPSCVMFSTMGSKVIRGQEGEALYWEAKTKLAKGSGGGPLLDKQGYLVGVYAGTSGETTYFCHISEIHRFLKKNGMKWLYLEEVAK